VFDDQLSCNPCSRLSGQESWEKLHTNSGFKSRPRLNQSLVNSIFLVKKCLRELTHCGICGSVSSNISYKSFKTYLCKIPTVITETLKDQALGAVKGLSTTQN
jgi:hypothetical protein